MCPLAKLIELGGEVAGGGKVQLSDSFTRTPPTMDSTLPRISVESTSPSKEKVVQSGRHSLMCRF